MQSESVELVGSEGATTAGIGGADGRVGPNKGLTIPRVFSKDGVNPYEAVEWETRTAEIKDADGNIVFRQEGCEFPASWSQQATNIVASKYFYGDAAAGNGSPEDGKREFSVKQLVGRVVSTIAGWGNAGGYFDTYSDGFRFECELASICLGQYAAFNSPVWFNAGLFAEYGIEGPANGYKYNPATGVSEKVSSAYEFPNIAACYIGSVGDDMESIMESAKTEAMLFKFGSGYGADLSTLRSSREKLTGGGKPSGPVSFFKVFDTVASIIKSGGKTRRAARMQTLKCWHPDVVEFIDCKAKEDRKARALIGAGYSDGITGHPDEAYSSVMFQNTNTAIRVTDEFMAKAAGEDPDPWYWTKAVTTGEPVESLNAATVLDKIAASNWECGDPGLQFEDAIQEAHTLSNTAPINASNPCAEYLSIDDSACNLASLNLVKFRREDGTFDVAMYRTAVRVLIIAMDILVENASYPTAKIAENAYKFRQLGLGYANMGALLMSWGLPYDSEQGRTIAGSLTGILSGESYAASAELAGSLGPFAGYPANADPMRNVMTDHLRAAIELSYRMESEGMNIGPWHDLPSALNEAWTTASMSGADCGYRNSQSCVIAPTGTIAFMMDCDTTGIEPELGLVKYKKLSGGGVIKIVNGMVLRSLHALGYGHLGMGAIQGYIAEYGSAEGAPGLKPEHLPVFDCAFPAGPGRRSISWEAHVRMLAAVQPFVSGAISKTVCLPNSATVEDFKAAYILGWKLGLKCMAVYRDGSKGQQPLTTTKVEAKIETPVAAPEDITCVPCRERLPDTRRSVTHKFSIGGHEGYVTIGLYPDGRPGEMFIRSSKEGSTIGGLLDVWATSISIGLQYGVPIEVLADKFARVRFEPAGFTKNPDIPMASSIVDYVFRWLGMEFIPGYREANAPVRELSPPAFESAVAAVLVAGPPPPSPRLDGGVCRVCGQLLVRRAGTCYVCDTCGFASGGCS